MLERSTKIRFLVKLFGEDSPNPSTAQLKAMWDGQPTIQEDIFDRYSTSR